jgi:hypothetical protein
MTKLKVPPPSERQIQQQILNYLNSQKGCYAFHCRNGATYDPRGFYRAGSSHRGVSDIIGSFRGHALFVEVKTQKGKISAEQVLFIEKMKQTGAIAFVARCLEDVIAQLFKTTHPSGLDSQI